MKKNSLLIYNLGITIFLILYVIINSTNLNPLYYEGAMFYGVTITIYILAFVISKIGKLNFFRDEYGNVKFSFDKGSPFPKYAKYLLIGIWIFIGFMMLMSTVLFNVDKYKNQMPDAEVKEFTSDLQPIDISQIPIVDKSMAMQLADKKLGERQSLGSQVYLGEPVIQRVNSKLVWVVPLHHSGFFKWLNNLSGTPGYIVVSATNTQNVEYVEGYKIKYHPNSFFFDDLKRYVRLKSSLFQGITDYSFELDETGQPYWVITTYKNKAGFSLPEADGAIIVHATNGDIQKYSLNDIPSWVDRIQPEHFIINQINNKGKYIRGLFNFSNKDKYKTSNGHAIIYNNDKCYLFTGLTSVGADDSSIGFMMVDMVTKEPKLYKLSGATENASRQSAQGSVQQFGYSASFPIILNYDSIPTYFMTLKDKSGLIKQFAMVSVKNYLLVGTGETVVDTMNNYKKILQNNYNDVGDNNKAKTTITAKVVRISSHVENENSVYSFILDSVSDKVFTVTNKISPQVPFTRDGDSVTISYFPSDLDRIPVTDFKNLNISK